MKPEKDTQISVEEVQVEDEKTKSTCCFNIIQLDEQGNFDILSIRNIILLVFLFVFLFLLQFGISAVRYRFLSKYNPSYNFSNSDENLEVTVKLAGNGEIIFVRPDENISQCNQFFTMTSSGSDVKKLVISDYIKLGLCNINLPTYSKDGKLIAFKNTTKAGESLLYVMNSDGTGVKNLDLGRGINLTNFHFSPNGRFIYFQKSLDNDNSQDKSLKIEMVSVEGRNSMMFEISHQLGLLANPKYTPDNKYILCVNLTNDETDGKSLVVMNTDEKYGFYSHTLSCDNLVSTDSFVISPDGQFVAYIGFCHSTSMFYISLLNFDGTARETGKLYSCVDEILSLSFSPDAKFILFTQVNGGNLRETKTSIYRIGLEEEMATELLSNGYSANWQPITL